MNCRGFRYDRIVRRKKIQMSGHAMTLGELNTVFSHMENHLWGCYVFWYPALSEMG